MLKIIAISLLLVSCAVAAQERSYNIDKVEVIARTRASRLTLQKVDIDTNLLQSNRTCSLGDLLLQNSPINIKSYGRGDTQTATFRGTAPSHTAVFWNGVRINSPMVGAVDFSLIPLFFVDRVSVDAGVSAMETTNGALGGAVTMESVAEWAKPRGFEILQSVGSFATSDSYANVRIGNSNIISSTKAFYSYSKNDFPFVNRDIIDPSRPDYRPTEHNKNGSWHRSGFMQEIFSRLAANKTLNAVVWSLTSDRNIPQLTTYEGDENQNLTNRRESSLSGALTYNVYNKKSDFMIRLTMDIQSMNFFQENKVSNGYQTIIDSKGLTRSFGMVTLSTFKLSPMHTFDIKSISTYDYVDSHESVRNQGFEKGRFESNFGTGFHSAWSEWLFTTFNLGWLYIHSQLFAAPFASMSYRLSSPISIKARLGYNIHYPTIADLYFVPGGNPDLKAERQLTAEAGASYKQRNINVDINLFNSWIKDWIVWLPTHQQYWTPRNMRNVLSQGVELTAKGEWQFSDIKLFTNLTFTLNRTTNNGVPLAEGDNSVGKQLVYVPLVSGGLFVRGVYKKMWLSLQSYGESAKYTTTANNLSSASTIAPYMLYNVATGVNLRKLSVELKCLNILNNQYYTVLRRPLPRRSFALTARLSIW